MIGLKQKANLKAEDFQKFDTIVAIGNLQILLFIDFVATT